MHKNFTIIQLETKFGEEAKEIYCRIIEALQDSYEEDKIADTNYLAVVIPNRDWHLRGYKQCQM